MTIECTSVDKAVLSRNWCKNDEVSTGCSGWICSEVLDLRWDDEMKQTERWLVVSEKNVTLGCTEANKDGLKENTTRWSRWKFLVVPKVINRNTYSTENLQCRVEILESTGAENISIWVEGIQNLGILVGNLDLEFNSRYFWCALSIVALSLN